MTEKILITSALPYVNNVPHIGNLVGAVLSADVFARFCRFMGKDTLYVCGSDEHGTATETKAKEEGVTPRELCDKYYALHKEIYEWFHISFDIFGRTSRENHKEITQALFNKVLAHGFIEEAKVVQPYSTKSNMFLADRFIIGTCPHCDYDEATGDQCDKCGKLLNPQDLINPKAKIDGSTPEFRETEHLFLNLEKLQKHLEKWVNSESAHWTDNAIRTTKAWFKEGLKKRAISRDLKWGVPIPETAFDGKYKDKVFYVWFDAPVGYISITAQLTENWQDWWQNKDVKLYQFMGKDNIPFHSIIFPATLMAASKDPKHPEYQLVHHLNSTEYLNYDHKKFSKSKGIGLFGDQAKESGIPADVYRYVIMYYRPENADTQFTWEGLQERLNNELVANLGNLVNRTITFTNRFFDSKVKAISENNLSIEAKEFIQKYRVELDAYTHLMSEVKLRDALMQVMKISSLGNQFFQEAQPWKTRTTHPEQAAEDLAILVNVVKDLSLLIKPFMPSISKEIQRQLNIEDRNHLDLGIFSVVDHKVNDAKVLFSKIEDDTIQELKTKYSGKQMQDKEHTQVQFTVGKIVEIKRHPDAEKLYIEKVDLGDKEIDIVSGLVPYYKEEELLGKHIVVVENLKPAKLRGVLSQGMLLAAEDSSGTVEVIDATDLPVGARFSDSAKEEIEFKDFQTLNLAIDEHKAFINGRPLEIQNLQLSTAKVKNGLIR